MTTTVDAVRGWLTSTEQARDRAWFRGTITMAHQLDPITAAAADHTPAARIRVDPTRRYQTILGIGTSLEESTVNNLAKLTTTRRDDAIKFLLDPTDGIGLTLFRLTYNPRIKGEPRAPIWCGVVAPARRHDGGPGIPPGP